MHFLSAGFQSGGYARAVFDILVGNEEVMLVHILSLGGRCSAGFIWMYYLVDREIIIVCCTHSHTRPNGLTRSI